MRGALELDIYTLLREAFPQLETERNFSFSRHTTVGCGGRAAVCAYPRGTEELAILTDALGKKGIPYCFLGAGANVLPQDGFFDGVVIRFSNARTLLTVGDRIAAGAGVTGGALLRFARENGMGGFEFLTGIPMTVGGAVVMNAGVQGGHIGDLVEQVVGVEGGKVRYFSARECLFGVKESVFQGGGIAVAGAILRGVPRPREEIGQETARYRARRAHLPKGRSMGCVFVNPPEISAGALIERCGLKGANVGKARVSELHANFIVNEGASGDDISRLIAFVKGEVCRKTGVLLREEIRRIP